MSAEVRRAKRTFNIVSISLIDQLLGLFKSEPTLMFFKSEIESLSKKTSDAHIPAANFFSTLNIETKINPTPDIERPDGNNTIVVGELIIRKDSRLFSDECGVVIPAIEALGLKEKWPKLSEANKEMVWDYLIRLSKVSAQVVLGMQMQNPEVQQIIKQVTQGASQLSPGASEEEYAKFSSHVQNLMHTHK